MSVMPTINSTSEVPSSWLIGCRRRAASLTRDGRRVRRSTRGDRIDAPAAPHGGVVSEFDGVDAAPTPTALVAVTVKVYVV